MAIVLDPSLCIVLRSGLCASPLVPFFLEGFLQYFSKIPSASHFTRERYKDAARTAESAIDWYSLVDILDDCGWCDVGNGMLSGTFVGKHFSATGVERRRAGVNSGGGFRLLYFVEAGFEGGFTGVDLFGVDTDFGAGTGEDACLFAADARRSRAGRMRFCGTVDEAAFSSAPVSSPAILLVLRRAVLRINTTNRVCRNKIPYSWNGRRSAE
jgi:hypothetical protein